jgi:hypothetical protein
MKFRCDFATPGVDDLASRTHALNQARANYKRVAVF